MRNVFILFLFFFIEYIPVSAQSESDWTLRLFNFSTDLTSISNNTISLAVDAAWLASEINNATTLTGTLTQNAQGSWNYSTSPSDKLVAVFNDGSSIEFKYTKINGYVDGDADDFKESHSMDFTAYSTNYINVRIISDIGPANNKTEWLNKITGSMVVNGNNHNVNIEHQGSKYSEIDYGFAFFTKDELVTGTSSSDVSSYQLNDQFHVALSHNSNIGFYNKDTQFWKNSSVTTGNISYAFQGVNVFYVGATDLYDEANNGIYNKVNESNKWSSEGVLFKNNQQYANIVFSSTPIDGTNGPYLIADIIGGGDIILHFLLNSVPTDIEDKSTAIITEFNLAQNYPNPFNPSTTIKYSIPSSSVISTTEGRRNLGDFSSQTNLNIESPRNNNVNVTLKIYDILGREVGTLVNKQQQPGMYEVKWNAAMQPSGIYFYRITAGKFSTTKKMILQK